MEFNTFKPGIDCLNYLNTFLDYLGDLDDMEDYMKTTLKCKVRNFFNRYFESFASYATATSLGKTEITFK